MPKPSPKVDTFPAKKSENCQKTHRTMTSSSLACVCSEAYHLSLGYCRHGSSSNSSCFLLSTAFVELLITATTKLWLEPTVIVLARRQTSDRMFSGLVLPSEDWILNQMTGTNSPVALFSLFHHQQLERQLLKRASLTWRDSKVFCLLMTLQNQQEAWQIEEEVIRIWIANSYSKVPRHQNRITKMTNSERLNLKITFLKAIMIQHVVVFWRLCDVF